jgi:hypothetical protein
VVVERVGKTVGIGVVEVLEVGVLEGVKTLAASMTLEDVVTGRTSSVVEGMSSTEVVTGVDESASVSIDVVGVCTTVGVITTDGAVVGVMIGVVVS